MYAEIQKRAKSMGLQALYPLRGVLADRLARINNFFQFLTANGGILFSPQLSKDFRRCGHLQPQAPAHHDHRALVDLSGPAGGQ